MRNWLQSVLVAGAAAIGPLSVAAQDHPVGFPFDARWGAARSGGLYVWANGSYQDVGLPTYGLGQKRVRGSLPFVDQGFVDSIDPRATGFGIAGGIGYVLPQGVSAFGSNLRVEFGLSYVDASGRQTAGTGPSGFTSNFFVVSLLNGALAPSLSECTPLAVTCTTASALSSDYRSWQLSGRIASDHRFGAVTVSPFIAVFGGETHNDQSFLQVYTQSVTVPLPLTAITTYSAETDFRWTDIGARLGVASQIDVNRWLALGLGGSVGLGSRHASLTGSDSFSRVVGAGVPDTAASTISTAAGSTALIANAEASLILRPLPAMLARAFLGLNYDSAVPGISGPGWVGSVLAATALIPASVNFSAQTSWYAGGGLTLAFAP